MTKITLAIVLIFIVLGAIFFFNGKSFRNTDKKDNNVEEISRLVPVVFTSDEIKKGQFFKEEKVKIRYVTVGEVPSDAIADKDMILERRASKNLIIGSIVSPDDVLYSDRTKWTFNDERREVDSKRQIRSGYERVVYIIRDVPAGQEIDSFSVEIKQYASNKLPKRTIHSLSSVIGKVAKYDLHQGQFVTENDIE